MRDPAGFRSQLLAWYRSSARSLDVRSASTPWAVLVAEVMSQQTQIERVGPAWRRFVDRWPSPAELAAADTAELMRAWAGLGYNRRALALRQAARSIVERHAGAVPGTVMELEALPGVGPYTARAVAATAFGVPCAPLDVNVRRVLERVERRRIAGRTGQADADALAARDAPGPWVNALMDLAACVCVSANPRCAECPVAHHCASRAVPWQDVAGGRSAGAGGRRGQRFVTTNRWLRGRVVAFLRDAAPGSWVRFDGPIGDHSPDAVRGALHALEREGFVLVRGDEARLS